MQSISELVKCFQDPMHVLVKALAVAGEVKESFFTFRRELKEGQFQCNSSPKSKCQRPPAGIK